MTEPYQYDVSSPHFFLDIFLSPKPYKFTGKERDSESGLDNFGARYDSSQYGRFMTPDWSAKPMGVPYAQLGDPQSLNLYSYVENNPLYKPDPDGHCALCALIQGLIGAGMDSSDALSVANHPAPPPSLVNLTPMPVPQSQASSKPVPVVIVTSDTTHPAPFNVGVTERDRIYKPGTMDGNGNITFDNTGRRAITLIEKQLAGNDNPTNCASGCTETGTLEDQIHVSGPDKYSTFRQDFRVDSNPALIVSGRPGDLAVSPAQIVRASATRIEIDPAQ